VDREFVVFHGSSQFTRLFFFLTSCFYALSCNFNWIGILKLIPASEMTYTVSGGALNSTHSLTPETYKHQQMHCQPWQNFFKL